MNKGIKAAYNEYWPYRRRCLTKRCIRIQTYDGRCAKHNSINGHSIGERWTWLYPKLCKVLGHTRALEHKYNGGRAGWGMCKRCSVLLRMKANGRRLTR